MYSWSGLRSDMYYQLRKWEDLRSSFLFFISFKITKPKKPNKNKTPTRQAPKQTNQSPKACKLVFFEWYCFWYHAFCFGMMLPSELLTLSVYYYELRSDMTGTGNWSCIKQLQQRLYNVPSIKLSKHPVTHLAGNFSLTP